MSMTERIEVQHVRKEGLKSVYYADEVKCPKAGAMIIARWCKHCEHCRIYLGDHVKCTYASDKRLAELNQGNTYNAKRI